jgi:hypothetical protein
MTTSVDNAVKELKNLPKDQQEIAAEAIMDFAKSANGLRLSPEQIEEVRQRLSDTRPTFVTLEEARARFSALGA